MRLAVRLGMISASQRVPTVREGARSLDELLGLAGVDDWAGTEPDIQYLDEPKTPEKPVVCSYRAGDEFGPYRLVRPIGCGGMGSVWVAHHRELDAEVAVKVLRSDMQDSAIIERFLIEARLLARIDHPAVVHVLDFGYTDRAAPFLVMELLNGQSLYDALRRQERFTPVEAVRLLLPIAHGLAAVHRKRIVHRDLKPDNIFLAKQDQGVLQPKLVDFGVARSLGGQEKVRLTLRGGLLGSPQYMSPEQARGELDIDHRADVWAFCAVLYECVAGHSLFPMEDTYERVLRRILDEKPKPLSEHGIDAPELWKIIEQGLRKHRERRWQSMADLGAALAHWLRARNVEDDVTGASLTSCWMRPLASSGSAASEPFRPPVAPASGIRSELRRLAAGRTTRGIALVAGIALGACLGSAGAWLSGAPKVAAAGAGAAVTMVQPPRAADQAPLSIEDLEIVTDTDDDPGIDGQAAVERVNDPSSGSAAPPRARHKARGSGKATALLQRRLGTKKAAPPSEDSQAAVSVAGRDEKEPARAQAEAAINTDSVEAFYGDLGF